LYDTIQVSQSSTLETNSYTMVTKTLVASIVVVMLIPVL
jgi:hypothetical protein